MKPMWKLAGYLTSVSRPSFMLVITNQTTRTYSDVWYVADNTTQIDIYEAIIDYGRAVRIDETGFYQPLLRETGGIHDGRLQPGETWSIAIEGYGNSLGFPVTDLTTAGIIGNTPAGFSSGSIIAFTVPEPNGMLIVISCVLCLTYFRTPIAVAVFAPTEQIVR